MQVVSTLRSFSMSCKKPFNEVTKEDIEKWALSIQRLQPTSQATMFIILKTFFKWFLKTEEIPLMVKWLKVNGRAHKKRIPPELLNEEEILSLLNVCDSMRDKCVISLLYDAGIRAGEAVGICIKDCKFDKFGCVIHVSGKTGYRPVRILPATANYLRDLINSHTHKNQKDFMESFIFLNNSYNQYGRPLSVDGVLCIVKRLARRAKISKRIFTHLFRATSATEYAKNQKAHHAGTNFNGRNPCCERSEQFAEGEPFRAGRTSRRKTALSR